MAKKTQVVNEGKFPIGTVVMLKSGGNPMTVTKYGLANGSDFGCWCSWHDKNGNERTWHYPDEALVLKKPFLVKM